jgi:hypothetical protein
LYRYIMADSAAYPSMRVWQDGVGPQTGRGRCTSCMQFPHSLKASWLHNP